MPLSRVRYAAVTFDELVECVGDMISRQRGAALDGQTDHALHPLLRSGREGRVMGVSVHMRITCVLHACSMRVPCVFHACYMRITCVLPAYYLPLQRPLHHVRYMTATARAPAG